MTTSVWRVIREIALEITIDDATGRRLLRVIGTPRIGWHVLGHHGQDLAHYADETDPYAALRRYRRQRDEVKKEQR